MAKHSPDRVAPLTAMLLFGRFDAEPHMIKQAIAVANLILDEVDPPEEEEAEPAPEPVASAPEPVASAPKPKTKPTAPAE